MIHQILEGSRPTTIEVSQNSNVSNSNMRHGDAHKGFHVLHGIEVVFSEDSNKSLSSAVSLARKRPRREADVHSMYLPIYITAHFADNPLSSTTTIPPPNHSAALFGLRLHGFLWALLPLMARQTLIWPIHQSQGVLRCLMLTLCGLPSGSFMRKFDRSPQGSGRVHHCNSASHGASVERRLLSHVSETLFSLIKATCVADPANAL